MYWALLPSIHDNLPDLDEISAALDVETEQALWERLRAHTGTTCLAVSHRRGVYQMADQTLILKDGKLETQGTLETLLQTSIEMPYLWQNVPAKEPLTA
jgi:ATP-binding cassette subfamily B protein